ncbi:MAG: 1-deoxy-D-xylulose-5-phosphate reductoisomerase [Bryobacterales bacterium]
MKLSLLGSTGSIGCNTLQVVRELPERPEVVALTAGRNVESLLEQALEFRPKLIALADEQARRRFLDLFRGASGTAGYTPDVLAGPAGNLAAAQNECDTLVSAAVGVAGMAATFEAVRLGKRVALANKETLVAGGEIVMAEAKRSGAAILPVDSEHNAAHQCLRAGRADEVDRLILTASGGPFRTTPREQLERVTPEQALNHPTWKMGARITIDSSTLMNKGFEVIEACHLFAFGPERVDVVVHPQSVVHALVEYRDGSVIAQLGPPDMKLPIRYALSYPARETGPADRRLSWNRVRHLDFEPPDPEKFPLLRLAYQTLEQGGTAGCVLNAADEIAVESFLQHEIPYVRIASVVEETLERMGAERASTIEETLAVDREARVVARELAAQHVASV